METSIRMAAAEDARALLAIYAPYVEQTAISFEYEVPTVAEFSRRISKSLERHPYLVGERDGEAGGNRYASAFHSQDADTLSGEWFVYVDNGGRQRGV